MEENNNRSAETKKLVALGIAIFAILLALGYVIWPKLQQPEGYGVFPQHFTFPIMEDGKLEVYTMKMFSKNKVYLETGEVWDDPGVEVKNYEGTVQEGVVLTKVEIMDEEGNLQLFLEETLSNKAILDTSKNGKYKVSYKCTITGQRMFRWVYIGIKEGEEEGEKEESKTVDTSKKKSDKKDTTKTVTTTVVEDTTENDKNSGNDSNNSTNSSNPSGENTNPPGGNTNPPGGNTNPPGGNTNPPGGNTNPPVEDKDPENPDEDEKENPEDKEEEKPKPEEKPDPPIEIPEPGEDNKEDADDKGEQEPQPDEVLPPPPAEPDKDNAGGNVEAAPTTTITTTP